MITVYTKRQKNAFIRKHDLANLLPELDKAITFDIQQLLQRNSAEVNRTLRIAALRSESDRLTELGQQVLAYLLASVSGVEWKNGRLALKGKTEVTIKTDLAFLAFIAQAKAEAEAKAAEAKAKTEAEAAQAKAEAEAKAAEAKAKAAEAKAKAKANKADEKAQQEAASAVFEAKAAESKLVAADRNITVKTAQAMLHGLIAGNLKLSNLQEANDTIHLLQLAAQAIARQAASVPTVEADEQRVEELAKLKASSAEKRASKKTA